MLESNLQPLVQLIDDTKESNSYIGDALLELLAAVSLLAYFDKMTDWSSTRRQPHCTGHDVHPVIGFFTAA